TGDNPHFGPARNPWDINRIPGGSSSGSAVAIATGMALAALGTDTGGSVRIPASFCGVVGLKPTFGRISKRGVIPLSWNLDHVGILTRTVEDAALLLQILAAYDPQDPSSVNLTVDNYLSGLKVGVYGWRICQATGEYIEGATAAQILKELERAANLFRRMGAVVEKQDLSWLQELAQANALITQADAAAFHNSHLADHPTWFGEDVRIRLYTGASLLASKYAQARRVQAEARRRFEQFFETYHILLLPTTPVVAPLMETIPPLQAAPLFTRFTAPFNLTGLPAISLPGGLVDGLPFGIQLVAAPWAEAKLLQAAFALEQAIHGGNLLVPPPAIR
ncbi:MAG: amidase, partial [Anaerolineales bacterium]|nr:amidase [Anaerolineales bacterium]